MLYTANRLFNAMLLPGRPQNQILHVPDHEAHSVSAYAPKSTRSITNTMNAGISTINYHDSPEHSSQRRFDMFPQLKQHSQSGC